MQMSVSWVGRLFVIGNEATWVGSAPSTYIRGQLAAG